MPQKSGSMEDQTATLNLASAAIAAVGETIPSKHLWFLSFHKGQMTATKYICLINRTPSSVLSGMSPYENCTLANPISLILKFLVALVLSFWMITRGTNYLQKSKVCIFLGYGIEQKGYRCHDPKTNWLRVSRNVTFLEDISFYSLPISSSEKPTFYPLDPFPDLFPIDSFTSQSSTSTSQLPPPPPLQVYHRRHKDPSFNPQPGSSAPTPTVSDPNPPQKYIFAWQKFGI